MSDAALLDVDAYQPPLGAGGVGLAYTADALHGAGTGPAPAPVADPHGGGAGGAASLAVPDTIAGILQELAARTRADQARRRVRQQRREQRLAERSAGWRPSRDRSHSTAENLPALVPGGAGAGSVLHTSSPRSRERAEAARHAPRPSPYSRAASSCWSRHRSVFSPAVTAEVDDEASDEASDEGEDLSACFCDGGGMQGIAAVMNFELYRQVGNMDPERRANSAATVYARLREEPECAHLPPLCKARMLRHMYTHGVRHAKTFLERACLQNMQALEAYNRVLMQPTVGGTGDSVPDHKVVEMSIKLQQQISQMQKDLSAVDADTYVLPTTGPLVRVISKVYADLQKQQGTEASAVGDAAAERSQIHQLTKETIVMD